MYDSKKKSKGVTKTAGFGPYTTPGNYSAGLGEVDSSAYGKMSKAIGGCDKCSH